MLYILWGQDVFSLYESLGEIKRGLGDQSLLEVNTTVLEGQQLALDQLRTVCGTVPFMAEKRLVIVKGLLGRYESRGKSSRQKKTSPASDRQKEFKSLVECVTQTPDSTVLVLIDDGQIKSSNPLFKELSARAEVRSFPLLKGNNLRQWIQRYVTEEGAIISSGAADIMAELVGGNLRTMANEIDKLVLFTAGRRIEEEDVRAVASYAQEASVFAMVDAILEFRAGVAGQLLQQLLQRGAAPAYLLTMLSRQVRFIVLAKELRSQGSSERETQGELGLTLDFQWRKVREQASKHTMERLKGVYGKLLETDLAIKTGKYGGELALNLLIAELGPSG